MPPQSERARLVTARHDACGSATRVRLPRQLPARVVRRVVCERCAVPYEPRGVRDDGVEGDAPGDAAPLPVASGTATLAAAEDAGSEPPTRRLSLSALRPPRPSLPSLGRAWRYLSLPLAAGLVLLALSALQAGDRPGARQPAAEPGRERPERADELARGRVASRSAQLVSEATYALALPAGWERVAGEGGATFAATAPEDEADATLWIERDPELDFATFEARSLAQLEQLAGSARVVERTPGPTAEESVVRIAAAAPPEAPAYEAILRNSGEYWYYLATTVQPGASGAALDGVELIQGSLVPGGSG